MVAKDFRSFNQGFTPYVGNIANILSQNIIANKQLEEQKKAEQKMAEEQQYKQKTQTLLLNNLDPDNLSNADLLYMANNPNVASAFNTRQNINIGKAEQKAATGYNKIIEDILKDPQKAIAGAASLPDKYRQRVKYAQSLQPKPAEYSLKKIENEQGFNEWRWMNKENPEDYQVYGVEHRKIGTVEKETDQGKTVIDTYSNGQKTYQVRREVIRDLKQDATETFNQFGNDWKTYGDLIAQATREAQKYVISKEEDMNSVRPKPEGGFEYTEGGWWDSTEDVVSPGAQYYEEKATNLRKQKLQEVYQNFDEYLINYVPALSDDPREARKQIQDDHNEDKEAGYSGNRDINRKKMNEIYNRRRLLRNYFRFKYGEEL